MNMRVIDHGYIIGTILLTVYSQMIIRWQVGLAGPLPASISQKIAFVSNLLVNPWVISAIVATFFAGVSWMLAMTRFEVSYAFPFVSMNFILILLASIFFFDESLNISKLIGTCLIVLGIIVVGRG